MRVRFIGSGDAFGSGGRLQTCILVEADGTRALIDCGASSLVGLKRFGEDPGALDAVLVTHLHGDHFGGIPFLLLDAQFAKRTRPLVLAGPPGLERRVLAAQEVLFPGSSQTRRGFPVEFVELPVGQSTPLGALQVEPHEVVHASGAPPYALRVAGGDRTVAYSGDTEWTPALLAAARGADLFICEAYFFEKKVRYHLDYRTLAEHRGELACRRILVTHMSDDVLRRAGELELEAAEDGLELLL